MTAACYSPAVVRVAMLIQNLSYRDMVDFAEAIHVDLPAFADDGEDDGTTRWSILKACDRMAAGAPVSPPPVMPRNHLDDILKIISERDEPRVIYAC